MQDPAIGRWWQLDPKAGMFPEWSPYNYSFNNPIRWNDPLGDCPTCNPKTMILGELKKTYDAVVQKVENTAEAVGDAVSDAVDYVLGSHEGDGGTQEGGIPMVTSGESASPTKQTAENTEAEVNVDVLLEAMGRANPGKFKKGSLDFAEGLSKVSDAVKTVNGMDSGANERPSEDSKKTEKTDKIISTDTTWYIPEINAKGYGQDVIIKYHFESGRDSSSRKIFIVH